NRRRGIFMAIPPGKPQSRARGAAFPTARKADIACGHSFLQAIQKRREPGKTRGLARNPGLTLGLTRGRPNLRGCAPWVFPKGRRPPKRVSELLECPLPRFDWALFERRLMVPGARPTDVG